MTLPSSTNSLRGSSIVRASYKLGRTMIRRRSFLTHLGAGVTAAGAAMTAGVSIAPAQSTGNGRWAPARHMQDDWFDQIPGKHRLLFDTSTAQGFGEALRFANTFLEANRDYGL